jgi:glycosyltransferase involved in cell wall biosynthesis
MPVYNAERYLREAIDSILNQTLDDFEFIIVNDGSQDSSEQIILSYDDHRIRYLCNEKNKGLVFTLNKAVTAANGTFIARMDADDISLPTRLEKQVKYLQRQQVHFVVTTVSQINTDGASLQPWKDDMENITSKEIKDFLKTDNCIAHPTVLGYAHIFKKYPYHHNQKYAEDYDLWLRLVNSGYRIEKIKEPLLLHRILPDSFTRSKRKNIYYGLAWVKFSFVRQQATNGKLSAYVLAVFLFACFDLIKAAGKKFKSTFTR